MATGPISFVGGVGGIGPQRIGSGKSIPPAVTRYFRRNEGTTDYAQFAAPITLASDFDLEIDVLATRLEQTILGTSSATNERVHFHTTATGALSLYSNTHGTVQVSSFTIPTDVITRVGFSRQGDILKLKNISSGQEDSFTGFSGDIMEFDYLYNYYVATNIWQGILANLKIWDNGTLIHDLPIDEPSDATIFDKVGSNNATVINGIDADRGKFTEQPTLWKGRDLTVPPWDSVDQELSKA